MKLKCKYCEKEYTSYQSRSNHIRIYHKKIIPVEKNIIIPIIKEDTNCIFCKKNYYSTKNKITHEKICELRKKYFCFKCNKKFISRKGKWGHEKECKIVKKKEIKIEDEDKENKLNNQLINIIVEKTKIIEELKNKINEKEIKKDITIDENIDTLNLNDILIFSRKEDNYINAIQLCQAGNKIFNDWISSNKIKKLINILEFKSKIKNNKLIEEDTWVHPDLAIQLAYWISQEYGLDVSDWIRKLFIKDNKYESLLEEIKIKNEKIKILEDTYIKKQKRQIYPEKNVIYMLTSDDNKKKNIYIIGKATNLTSRLSNYNKSAEHEVVYYKECKNEDDLAIIECMILNKLKDYREKANRDRFILPSNKDISFFINIIDNCVNFY